MKKKLAISILVSGRSETTEKCMESIKPLLEAVDSELILVDTGCDENMRNMLQTYTSQIISFTWCNDFAKARNVGLEQSNAEWFMFMDDDEWFEDVTPLITFFQDDICKDYDQAVYKVRNYSDYAGSRYVEEWVSRIIRVEKDTCFTGKVHEVLGPARGKCAKLDAFVHHYGYVHVDSDVLEKKVKRNAPLLLDMIAEEPNNLRWRIQLIQEYGSIKDYENMQIEAQKAIEYIKAVDKRFINQCRTVFETAILYALWETNCKEEAYGFAKEALKDKRNTMHGNVALSYYVAKAEEDMLQSQVGLYTEKGMTYAGIFLEYYDAWKEEEISEQESIIEQSLLFVKDVTTEAKYREMLRLYGVQCARKMKENNGTVSVEEIIMSKRQEQLNCLLHDMMYMNADFFHLPEDVWQMADAGILDMEAEWLSLEISQWEAALELLKRRGVIALEQAKQTLEKYQTCENLRYAYFKKEYVSVLIKLESTTESYEQLVTRFFDFMQGTLEYYLWIYRDEAFEGEMEMLPADAKAAVALNNMFSREQEDWEGKLADLRDCARFCPALGKNIKRLATMIGELMEQQRNEKANAANEELLQMVELMKVKIHELIAQGLYEDALSVVKQIRAIVPSDEELIQLEKEMV